MKGCGKIWWNKVNRIYTSEGEGGIVYYWKMDRIKEDKDVVAGRD